LLNQERAMICLEVLLNGEVICAAGDESGSVSLGLFTDRNNDSAKIHIHGARIDATKNDDLAPKIRAALQHPEPARIESLSWLDRTVMLGDEITIRIVERDKCDPPKIKTTRVSPKLWYDAS
jgi:hypothetical protein